MEIKKEFLKRNRERDSYGILKEIAKRDRVDTEDRRKAAWQPNFHEDRPAKIRVVGRVKLSDPIVADGEVPRFNFHG